MLTFCLFWQESASRPAGERIVTSGFININITLQNSGSEMGVNKYHYENISNTVTPETVTILS